MKEIKSTSKKLKVLHIIITVIEFLALCYFAKMLFFIGYSNIYQYARITGIEHFPLYLSLTIALGLTFLTSIITLILCKKFDKKTSIMYLIFVVIIAIAVILGVKVPQSTEYISKQYNKSQAEILPIDEYKYNENSDDYYYYHDVKFGNVHWVGSSSYKDFAAENTTVDMTEEVTDSTVFLNYYYLNDKTGHFIKDFDKKKDWIDDLSDYDYVTIKKIDQYTINEYDDDYEIMYESDNEVFYLTASKNKRTKYTEKDLVKIANELKSTLEKSNNNTK